MHEKRTVLGPHLNRKGMCHFASIERVMSAYFKKSGHIMSRTQSLYNGHRSLLFPREKIEKSTILTAFL
jgi:hypothetical protein